MKKLLIIAPIIAVLLAPALVGAAALVFFALFAPYGASACTPASDQAETVSTGSGTTSTGAKVVGARRWSAAQVANIQVVVGVAKGMFGKDAAKAELIGLMVANTESGFRNLANDNPAYPGLNYSLTLPNDGVGHDHSSVGIMQQQAIYSWGAFGSSTWASDPHGVIQRLMTPQYAVGKFYTAMVATDPKWMDKDPAAVAQEVQVSGPNAYASSLLVATALRVEFGGSSAIDPPAQTGWLGAAVQATADACQPGTAVVGDKQQLAKALLDNSKVTFLGKPGDRSNPLGQVQMVAAGKTGCNINMGILQLIAAAANNLPHVTISSINRNNTCTGKNSTTFDGSYHSIVGGGHAVDFTGNGVNGGNNAATKQLLNVLRPYLPARVTGDSYFTWIGQEQCRGYVLHWPGIYEGNDTCTHQHINVSPKWNDSGLPAFDTNPMVTQKG